MQCVIANVQWLVGLCIDLKSVYDISNGPEGWILQKMYKVGSMLLFVVWFVVSIYSWEVS